jgi:putative mRNA 3-end processing factor
VGNDLSFKAGVTERGAVLLGRYVACDAFDENKPLRVVTHAHADHTAGLSHSLRICEKVLMTPATRDLIEVMHGPLFFRRGNVETLEYGKTIHYDGEQITLFKADHILGAAQVLVEDAEGKRLVFTGDFRIEETPILYSDCLVIEATYGSPSCRRSFGIDVKTSLVQLVEKGLRTGSVYIFSYHGKLQETMQILRDACVEVPFVAPENVYRFSRVCEKHGMRLGELVLSSENEAQEMLAKDLPCVAFYHLNQKNKVGLDNFRVCVSGWEFTSAIHRTGLKEYTVALSDHSDFNGLLEYVKCSEPALVITDNSRVSHGETLAKEIRKRIGIDAISLPKGHPS